MTAYDFMYVDRFSSKTTLYSHKIKNDIRHLFNKPCNYSRKEKHEIDKLRKEGAMPMPIKPRLIHLPEIYT